MKCCIISANNMDAVPYFSYYKRIIKQFDLIIWDRKCEMDSHGKNEFIFRKKNTEIRGSKTGYFLFCLFVMKILLKNKYRTIVFLHSQLGVIMALFLRIFYKRKYICDIRDYEYEHNKLYWMLENIYVKNSLINIISSNGFKAFLPAAEYHILHNDRFVDPGYVDMYNSTQFDRIVIGNIGTFRFRKQNEQLLMALKNDERFLVKIYGQGAAEIRSFCKQNNIRNVEIMDGFCICDTMKHISGCNVLFNLYGSHNPGLDYLLSNRLYIAARFGMPVLVCTNTYMEQVACKYNFGIRINMDTDNLKEQIWLQYKSMDKAKRLDGCREFIQKVNKENLHTAIAIKDAISKQVRK